ncbi:hypothetical protein CXF85_20480 [Colwellia sp. 75C3]|uniref:hypothetical protein n=1 Tax=Colwellia sp. 75C3 TaxID=888425 RepID=UPI000C31D31B|nr:hypothetical protein [Colwellia sp. 75C3]PKG81133.1 hypothetical protein CXF85_20480 [Colwellia sp. 75C3]
MPSKVKNSLEAIIKMSRQLLSQLDIQIEQSESTDGEYLTDNKQTLVANVSMGMVQSQLTNEQLLGLVNERQSFIATLFEEHTQDQLTAQLALINEMVLLDEQLTLKSKSHKQSLATKVLKLKKSQKVSNLYKKY